MKHVVGVDMILINSCFMKSLQSLEVWCKVLTLAVHCCRSCWEVACYDTDFNDGYGEYMHRSNACRDTGLSVKVKIVDR